MTSCLDQSILRIPIGDSIRVSIEIISSPILRRVAVFIDTLKPRHLDTDHLTLIWGDQCSCLAYLSFDPTVISPQTPVALYGIVFVLCLGLSVQQEQKIKYNQLLKSADQTTLLFLRGKLSCRPK